MRYVTDHVTTYISSGAVLARNSWAPTRGAQLTAGYNVNMYSKPPLYYTLGATAPLLPCSCRAYARRRSTAHTLGPGGPLPHADRQTDARQTRLTTNKPANQPANRTAAVLPVPSCKLGNSGGWGHCSHQFVHHRVHFLHSRKPKTRTL